MSRKPTEKKEDENMYKTNQKENKNDLIFSNSQNLISDKIMRGENNVSLQSF